MVWKAGKIAPRTAFSRAERETDAAVTRSDIESVAEYVKGRVHGAERPTAEATGGEDAGGANAVPSFEI